MLTNSEHNNNICIPRKEKNLKNPNSHKIWNKFSSGPFNEKRPLKRRKNLIPNKIVSQKKLTNQENILKKTNNLNFLICTYSKITKN